MCDESNHQPAGFCPQCGYAIDPGTCPECGTDVPEHRLRSRRPRLALRRWLRSFAVFFVLTALACSGLGYYWLVHDLPRAPTEILLLFATPDSDGINAELLRRIKNKSLTNQQVLRGITKTTALTDVRAPVSILYGRPLIVELELEYNLALPVGLWSNVDSVTVNGIDQEPIRDVGSSNTCGEGSGIITSSVRFSELAVGKHRIEISGTVTRPMTHPHLPAILPPVSIPFRTELTVRVDSRPDVLIETVYQDDLASEVKAAVELSVIRDAASPLTGPKFAIRGSPVPIALVGQMWVGSPSAEQYVPLSSPWAIDADSSFTGTTALNANDGLPGNHDPLQVVMIPDLEAAYIEGIDRIFGGVLIWEGVSVTSEPDENYSPPDRIVSLDEFHLKGIDVGFARPVPTSESAATAGRHKR